MKVSEAIILLHSKNTDVQIAFANCLNIKTEISGFSETWFRQESITEEICYNSYHISKKKVEMGRGISIYLGNKYKFFLLNDISVVSDVI